MILADCSLIPYRLPLRQAWRSARGGFDSRRGWLVRLESDTGLVGYGDCAPLPVAGTESPETAAATLNRLVPALRGLAPDAALRELDGMASGAPAARCGLETALLDLLAQQAGLPLARWLNPEAQADVRVNAVLGGLDEGVMARAQAAVAAGHAVLKLKVGLAAGQEELPLLRDLAQGLPAGVGLRLDANRAWDEATARAYLGALTGLPVESVEDPLASPELAGWHRLQAGLPFPLAADESLAILGADALLDPPPVRRVVLKPMVLGGLKTALSLARRAQRAGVECVVTTTVDSAIGVSAALHLAAAVANDLAHGLATSSWLERDVGRPSGVAGGRMPIAGVPGLGCAAE